MADVTKLAINGQTYTIKDSIARAGVETAQTSANSAQTLANTANSTANTAKSTAESANTTATNASTIATSCKNRLDELSGEYDASTETISFNINV